MTLLTVTIRSTRILKSSFVLPLCLALCAAPALFAQASPVAPAAKYYEPGDGSQRINMAGRLRMLSQRIPSMACNKADGIEPEKSSANLTIAVSEFSAILKALEIGDEDLGIFGPEKRGKTLIRIEQVNDMWTPFGLLAADVSDVQSAARAIDVLAKDSGPLLANAVILVSDVVDQYFNPVVTIQAEAMTIDFAGRQRMLVQRMSKNVCLISRDLNEDLATAELSKAYELFDATLNALQTGMPSVGISVPPNQAVVDGLQVVAVSWAEMSPLMQRAMGGEEFDDATRTEVFNGMNDLTGKMNKVVHLYADASLLGRS